MSRPVTLTPEHGGRYWHCRATRNNQMGRPRWEGITPEQRDLALAWKKATYRWHVQEKLGPPPGAPPYLTPRTAPKAAGGRS